MKRILQRLGSQSLSHKFLLCSLLIACVVAWKPVTDPDVSVSILATQVRVISKWTNVSGSDSVRVQVSFGTQAVQNKQYAGVTHTADTTFFVAVPGESNTGTVIITAVKIGRPLTPFSQGFGPVTIPPSVFPPVTGVTVTADTL